MRFSKANLVPDSRLRKSFGRLHDLGTFRQTSEVFGKDRAVQAGSIVYVAKNVEHRFYSIEEELTVLVFFAPAEYSLINKEE